MTEAEQSPPYGSVDRLDVSTVEKTNRPTPSNSTSGSSDSGAIKQDVTIETPNGQMTRGKMINTLIICLLQLLNFMDRYALPGKVHVPIYVNNKYLMLNV
jgi:hypothetical protein